MADGGADNLERDLRKLVVAVPMSDEHEARLRAQFPGLEVVRVPFDDLEDAIPDADAVFSWRLTPGQLAAATRLAWFQTFGAGVDSVLIPELIERDIVITNSSGVHGPNIAEHLMAMILAFARGLPRLVRAQTRSEGLDDAVRGGVFEVNGQSLLVVGVGEIGIGLAERAGAFGMRVSGVRRRTGLPVPPGFAEVHGVDRLPEVVPAFDHVAICLPLTARTRGLFDGPMIARMMPTAYLYNIGRGPIVDTDALVKSLQAGRLGGAGLDVTDPEPLPPDSPLWQMENVLITAHTSGATPRYWDRLMDILIANIERFRAGEPLLNRIDIAEGY